MKKFNWLLAAALVAVPLFAFAASFKYTFNNVMLTDMTVIEMEATVKDTQKSQLTRCDYYSDNYITWLGYYQEPIVAGTTADAVKTFCVSNFGNRVQ